MNRAIWVAGLSLAALVGSGAASAANVSWSVGVNLPAYNGLGFGTVISNAPPMIVAPPVRVLLPPLWVAPPPAFAPGPAFFASPRYWQPRVVIAPRPPYGGWGPRWRERDGWRHHLDGHGG